MLSRVFLNASWFFLCCNRIRNDLALRTKIRDTLLLGLLHQMFRNLLWTAKIVQSCVMIWKFRRWVASAWAVINTGGILRVFMLLVKFNSAMFSPNRRTGVLRPTQGPHNIPSSSRPRSKSNKLYYYQGYHDSSGKYKKKPPKGMFINHDDVVKLAAIDKAAKATQIKQPGFLAEVEREINVLYTTVSASSLFFISGFKKIHKIQIQKNKQKISSLKSCNGESHDAKMLDEVALTRISTRWTKDECSLAILGFRKYGQNFKVSLRIPWAY